MNAQRADGSTFDYQHELERRIAQFDGCLRKMYRRAHEEVCGPCFLIFEEQRPDADSGKTDLAEAAKKDKDLSEDEVKRFFQQLDDIMQQKKSQIDQLEKAKQQEILTV